jgi:hypothetical protein
MPAEVGVWAGIMMMVMMLSYLGYSAEQVIFLVSLKVGIMKMWIFHDFYLLELLLHSTQLGIQFITLIWSQPKFCEFLTVHVT